MEAIVSTNDINNYSVSELNYLRESVENMNKLLGLFIGTIATVIVMLGGYFLSLYAQKEISLV